MWLRTSPRPGRCAGRRPPGGSLLAALLLVLLSCAAPVRPPDLAGTDLLLVTIDTLRADRVGAYGHRGAATPVLDGLAAAGVRFAACYSSVPLTLPSHGVLFTGRYPFALGVRNNGSYRLADGERTLAERLRERGYRTAAFVSSFIVSSRFGLGQGFDHYDDGLGGAEALRSFSSEIPADRVVDRFRAWLAAERPERFFVWLHLYDPHQPYAAPEPWGGRFAADPYDGEVAFVDFQLGRALEALREAGRLERTVVVATSDHGEGFGEHGETGHGILAYDEALRVPLIVAAGERLRPAVVEQRVGLVDLLPTLVELYGLGAEGPPMQGGSFARLLAAGAPEGEPRDHYFESVLGREDFNWAAITGLISGRFKYIALPEPELYDLEADPGERENLAAVRAGTARELDEKLRALLLASEGAPSRREMTAEEEARLRSLGYLSGTERRTAAAIDPKRGLWIDRAIKEIGGALDADDAEAARRLLDDLLERIGDVEMQAVYAIRHQVLVRSGERAAARRVLEEGVAAFPGSERLRLLLAHQLIEEGRPAEAEEVARWLLERRPEFAQGPILLAEAAARRGEAGRAAELFRQAVRLEPNNRPLKARLARALLEDGRPEEALEVYDGMETATGLEAADAEWIYTAAVLNARHGRLDRAEEHFRRGLSLAPAGVHHLAFGLLLGRNGKPAEAVRQLEIAVGEYGGELSADQRAMAAQALDRWRGGG